MTRLSEVFKNGKAFMPFITAGDPSLDVTEELIYAMADAGADLIELGIPFSDPLAEGPVIQDASSRALTAGATTDKIFDMVSRIRSSCRISLAFMTYINPVFAYGSERFMKNCQEAEIDAVIVPDMPFEEKKELQPYCNKYGVALISLISPTSHNRIKMIADDAEGFIYCVSSLGVTGVRSEIGDDAKTMIKIVKETKDIPCAVGFGISTPAQAAATAEFADGVIAGSAIVKLVGEYGNESVSYVADYVKSMKNAII